MKKKTTVQVEKETLNLLKEVLICKRESYNEAILRLIAKEKKSVIQTCNTPNNNYPTDKDL
jgi:hypothetical protein